MKQEIGVKNAPYVYTAYGEEVAIENGIKNRKKGGAVFFGYSLLGECGLANTWLECGYIVKNDMCDIIQK